MAKGNCSSLQMLLIVALLAAIYLWWSRRSESFEGGKLELYLMDGCPHCVRFKPEISKIQTPYEIINANERERVRAAGVKGFPTIKYGDKIYEGPRTAQAIDKWVASM